jgi:hypothetical protein
MAHILKAAAAIRADAKYENAHQNGTETAFMVQPGLHLGTALGAISLHGFRAKMRLKEFYKVMKFWHQFT